MKHSRSILNQISEHRFVFVAGLHRSGTTLVFRLLRDHPQISGFRFADAAEREHEGQHLQSVYPSGTQNGGPGYFAFQESAHLTEDSSLVGPENSARLFEEWAQHWDLSKPYLLEKSPPNLVMTRFLQELFPNSYFVIVVRHPIVVTLATLKWMGWPRYVLEYDLQPGEKGVYSIRRAETLDYEQFMENRRLFMESMIYTLLDHWRVAHELFFSDRKHLERVTVIRYEDLVSDPESSLARLTEFLQLDGDELVPEETVEDHNSRYFSEWASFPSHIVSPDFKLLLENQFREHLKRFGYSVSKVMVEHPIHIEWSRVDD